MRSKLLLPIFKFTLHIVILIGLIVSYFYNGGLGTIFVLIGTLPNLSFFLAEFFFGKEDDPKPSFFWLFYYLGLIAAIYFEKI